MLCAQKKIDIAKPIRRQLAFGDRQSVVFVVPHCVQCRLPRRLGVGDRELSVLNPELVCFGRGVGFGFGELWDPLGIVGEVSGAFLSDCVDLCDGTCPQAEVLEVTTAVMEFCLSVPLISA